MKLNVILVDVYYVKKHKSKENLTSSKEDRAILRAYIKFYDRYFLYGQTELAWDKTKYHSCSCESSVKLKSTKSRKPKRITIFHRH